MVGLSPYKFPPYRTRQTISRYRKRVNPPSYLAPNREECELYLNGKRHIAVHRFLKRNGYSPECNKFFYGGATSWRKAIEEAFGNKFQPDKVGFKRKCAKKAINRKRAYLKRITQREQ